MNPDHDPKPLLHDVLRGDHDALRASSLDRMLDESRRAQRVKRNLRRTGVAAALVAVAGLGLLRPQATRENAGAKTRPVGESTARQATVRQLTDAELRHRLERFAVAYIGEAPSRRIVMIEPWNR